MPPFVCTIRLRDFCENKMEKDVVLLRDGLQCEHYTCCQNQRFLLQEANKLGFDCRSDWEINLEQCSEHTLEPPFPVSGTAQDLSQQRSHPPDDIEDKENTLAMQANSPNPQTYNVLGYHASDSFNHKSLPPLTSKNFNKLSPLGSLEKTKGDPHRQRSPAQEEMPIEFSTPPSKQVPVDSLLFSGLYSPSLTTLIEQDERDFLDELLQQQNAPRHEQADDLFRVAEEEEEDEEESEEDEHPLFHDTIEEEASDLPKGSSPITFLFSSLQNAMSRKRTQR